jgi:hypothetical protein
VLEFNFNWKKLSAAAGLTFRNFYFRLYPDAVRGPEVIDWAVLLHRWDSPRLSQHSPLESDHPHSP